MQGGRGIYEIPKTPEPEMDQASTTEKIGTGIDGFNGNEIQQPSGKHARHAGKFHRQMRIGLLKAAGTGLPLPEWLQRRSVQGLGDSYVRLKAELQTLPRDQSKITRILDELDVASQESIFLAAKILPRAGEGHAHTTGPQEEDEESEYVEEVDVALRKPRQFAKDKKTKKNAQPSEETLENRRRFAATMRRCLLLAAEKNTPLPQWLHRHKADRLGDFFVRLRMELLAPVRDQARVSQMLAELGPDRQDANQDGNANLMELVGDRRERDNVEIPVQATQEQCLPASDAVGDGL